MIYLFLTSRCNQTHLLRIGTTFRVAAVYLKRIDNGYFLHAAAFMQDNERFGGYL